MSTRFVNDILPKAGSHILAFLRPPIPEVQELTQYGQLHDILFRQLRQFLELAQISRAMYLVSWDNDVWQLLTQCMWPSTSTSSSSSSSPSSSGSSASTSSPAPLFLSWSGIDSNTIAQIRIECHLVQLHQQQFSSSFRELLHPLTTLLSEGRSWKMIYRHHFTRIRWVAHHLTSACQLRSASPPAPSAPSSLRARSISPIAVPPPPPPPSVPTERPHKQARRRRHVSRFLVESLAQSQPEPQPQPQPQPVPTRNAAGKRLKKRLRDEPLAVPDAQPSDSARQTSPSPVVPASDLSFCERSLVLDHFFCFLVRFLTSSFTVAPCSVSLAFLSPQQRAILHAWQGQPHSDSDHEGSEVESWPMTQVAWHLQTMRLEFFLPQSGLILPALWPGPGWHPKYASPIVFTKEALEDRARSLSPMPDRSPSPSPLVASSSILPSAITASNCLWHDFQELVLESRDSLNVFAPMDPFLGHIGLVGHRPSRSAYLPSLPSRDSQDSSSDSENDSYAEVVSGRVLKLFEEPFRCITSIEAGDQEEAAAVTHTTYGSTFPSRVSLEEKGTCDVFAVKMHQQVTKRLLSELLPFFLHSIRQAHYAVCSHCHGKPTLPDWPLASTSHCQLVQTTLAQLLSTICSPHTPIDFGPLFTFLSTPSGSSSLHRFLSQFRTRSPHHHHHLHSRRGDSSARAHNDQPYEALLLPCHWPAGSWSLCALDNAIQILPRLIEIMVGSSSSSVEPCLTVVDRVEWPVLCKLVGCFPRSATGMRLAQTVEKAVGTLSQPSPMVV